MIHAVITIVPLFLLGVVFQLFAAAHIVNGFSGQLLGAGIGLIAYWFVVQAMFAKKFNLFRFVVRRRGSLIGR
jgi:hypothetical protein